MWVSLNSRPAWSKDQISGQLGLFNRTSQKQTNKKHLCVVWGICAHTCEMCAHTCEMMRSLGLVCWVMVHPGVLSLSGFTQPGNHYLKEIP